MQRNKKYVIMKIVPVTLEGPNGKIDTHAFVDSGSTVTLIKHDLAGRLGLQGQIDPLCSKWMNKMTFEDNNSRRISLRVTGNCETFNMKNIRTLKDLELPCQPVATDISKLSHLKDDDLSETGGVVPEILVGEDYMHVKIALKVVVGKKNEPVATLMPLGWTVHGPFIAARANQDCVLLIHHSEEDELSGQLKNFWTVESFGVDNRVRALRSKEDTRAEEILNRTARRQGEHWETGPLWKSDTEILTESKKLAEKRFRSLENKMEKDRLFKEQYNAKIDEYCAKGYARVLSAEEEKRTTERTWYLPHFAVSNPNKPRKIRLLFDAAAKSRGVSLNDRLLKGPDLYNSPVGILSIFRERSIAMCGDLREMFHQIRIREEDHGSQRFLNRNQQTGELLTF